MFSAVLTVLEGAKASKGEPTCTEYLVYTTHKLSQQRLDLRIVQTLLHQEAAFRGDILVLHLRRS